MRLLLVIFLCMAIYGFTIKKPGAASLSLGMVVFVAYGARELRKRDIEFYLSPRSARLIPTTLERLHEQGAEGTRSRF